MSDREEIPNQKSARNPVSSRRTRPDTVKSRFHRLEKLVGPVLFVGSLVSGIGFLYRFIAAAGDVSYPILIFVSVSIFGLLWVPSARLFVFRTLAFILDLAFLSVITGVPIFAYRRIHGEPSEFALMGVAWFWFFYFAFLDWNLKGTPGKRIMGLRIISLNGSFDFLRSLLRTLLSLVVPVILSWFGSALAAAGSPPRWIAGMTLRYAIVLLVPISILAFEGNQGVVDKILNTAVKYERGTNPQRQPPTKWPWAKFFSLVVLCGIALSTVDYVAVGRQNFLDVLPTPNGRNTFNTRAVQSDKDIAALWMLLPRGLRNPAQTIQLIEIQEISRNIFVTGDTQIVIPSEIRQQLEQAQGHVHVLRVVVISSASPAVYSLIMRNLSELMASSLSPNQRELTVLQFGQTDDYGLFLTTQTRNTLVSVTRTGDSNLITFTDLNPPQNGITSAIEPIRWLLLGDLDIREDVKYLWSP